MKFQKGSEHGRDQYRKKCLKNGNVINGLRIHLSCSINIDHTTKSSVSKISITAKKHLNICWWVWLQLYQNIIHSWHSITCKILINAYSNFYSSCRNLRILKVKYTMLTFWSHLMLYILSFIDDFINFQLVF